MIEALTFSDVAFIGSEQFTDLFRSTPYVFDAENPLLRDYAGCTSLTKL